MRLVSTLWLATAFAAYGLGSSLASAQDQAPIPEVSGNVIGYATVAEALADLKKRTDLTVAQQRGWTVISDEKNHVVWSFPSRSDPAYPSAVRRSIKNENGAAYVNSDILCESTKAACDNLVRQFNELDAQMREALRGRR